MPTRPVSGTRHSCPKAPWPHGRSGQPRVPRAAPVQSKLALPSVWGFYERESSHLCHVQKDWECLPITWTEAYAYEGSRSRETARGSSERMTSRGGGLAGARRSDTGDLSGCEAELTAQRCPWPPADAGDEQPCSRTGPSVVRETPGRWDNPTRLGPPGPPEPPRGQQGCAGGGDQNYQGPPGMLVENIRVGVIGLKGLPCHVDKTYKNLRRWSVCAGQRRPDFKL